MAIQIAVSLTLHMAAAPKNVLRQQCTSKNIWTAHTGLARLHLLLHTGLDDCQNLGIIRHPLHQSLQKKLLQFAAHAGNTCADVLGLAAVSYASVEG